MFDADPTRSNNPPIMPDPTKSGAQGSGKRPNNADGRSIGG